jgi:hypothetical protein
LRHYEWHIQRRNMHVTPKVVKINQVYRSNPSALYFNMDWAVKKNDEKNTIYLS